MATNQKSNWGLFTVLAASTGGALLLAYLASGRREQDSSLIPNALEDRIDHLVAFLDKKFTKRWVDKGMDTLQRAIQAKFPGMASVLNAVVAAEQMGSMLGWSGGTKKGFALRQFA